MTRTTIPDIKAAFDRARQGAEEEEEESKKRPSGCGAMLALAFVLPALAAVLGKAV